jgi:hypothetical protein
MSYLDRPRLTFFGQFTANPSTINNLPANYGEPLPYNQTSTTPGGINWNPYGSHNFSLNNCAVTNLVMDGDSGTVQGTVNATQAGVLVDLDVEQQLVSQIIGMQLTVTVGGGSVTGTFMPVNFFDINFARVQGNNVNAQGDGAAGAAYQSVLTNLTWNESGSPFLTALKAASPSMLSIRMNVDAHHGIYGDPLFTTGRVTGTIGPYFDGEPLTFTNARFLRPLSTAYSIGGWNAVPAKLDQERRKLVVDLGNATPWTWNGFSPAPTSSVRSVQVAAVTFLPNVTPPVVGGILSIGPPDNPISVMLPQTVDTSDAAYWSNAFVQELDVPEAMLSAVASNPLAIIALGSIVSTENPSGAYVNAEPYVFRLDPGKSGEVTLWANIFQAPASLTTIPLQAQDTWLINQQSDGPAPADNPPNGVTFPDSVKTDSNGKATFTIQAATFTAPPRGPIPGQVYGIGWNWALDQIPDQWNFLSVKVFQSIPVPAAPTWWQDVYPILVQYAYLYPAMQEIIQLDNYDAVVMSATAIIARLNLPDDAPGQMPITRELSTNQRTILTTWAQNPEHPQGTPPDPLPQPVPLPPEPITIDNAQ